MLQKIHQAIRFYTYLAGIAVFLLMCVEGLAQTKEEYERRAKKSEIPVQAKRWLRDAFEAKKKVDWYVEISENESTSYEAKFKWNKEWYSVEFSEGGLIEDIEVEKRWEELDLAIRENVLLYIENTYKNHRIRKIQLQYTGEADDLEDLIDEDESEDITIKYEIEYFGQSEESKDFWEGLFDATGKLISKKRIEIRATDNMDYE